MKPESVNHYSVKAKCNTCGAVSVFDHKQQGSDLPSILLNEVHTINDTAYGRTLWRLLRCSSCSRGALGQFFDNGSGETAVLASFLPRAVDTATLPIAVPDGVKKEYREAELCASTEAWRAASALLRSALEKTLKANGYTEGSLQQKIDEAAADGVITSARRQKAHDDVRVLGNEVVHDEWRVVDEDEVSSALHYVQRILEDLYDDRKEVETVLRAKQRLP